MSRVVLVVVSSFVAIAVNSIILAGSAFAQDPPATQPPPVAQQTASSAASVFEQPGFDFGARLGYALPFGNTDGDDKLSDGVSGAVPVVLEVGYRLNANFTVGALFQYGIAQVKSNDTTGCNASGVDCSGSVIRLGVEGIYNLDLDAPLRPWVGISTGYEWFGITASAGGQSASASAKGFEFVTLHAGGDYRMSPNFALGPFVSFSLAQYGSATIELPGSGSATMDLTDKKMHEWLQLGVRGRFGI
jgi:hypothetical protein